MNVQMTKRPDGDVVLRCVRRDGSATWQRHEKHAHFFSFHDLTHFAVETTLGFSNGFYGLIAAGWDITDTTGKGARGKLPPEAILVEHVVGLLHSERAGGAAPLSADGFNTEIGKMLGTGHEFLVTDTQLSKVRNRMQELHRLWAEVPAGATFELTFDSDSKP